MHHHRRAQVSPRAGGINPAAVRRNLLKQVESHARQGIILQSERFAQGSLEPLINPLRRAVGGHDEQQHGQQTEQRGQKVFAGQQFHE